MGETNGKVQNRRKRTLNWALKGKQVSNNNRESSLERAYAKAQKHGTQGNNEELRWDKEYSEES